MSSNWLDLLATPQVRDFSLHSIEYDAYFQATHYAANKTSSLLPSAFCSLKRQKESNQIIQTVGNTEEKGSQCDVLAFVPINLRYSDPMRKIIYLGPEL